MQKPVHKLLAALTVMAVGAGGYFVWARTKSAEFVSSIDAIPDGALLVATADVGVLRKTGVMAPVFSEGREIAGLGKVRDVCGFDPMDSMTELGIGVPATGNDGDFGLVAVGNINADALLECASKVIEARGGRAVVSPMGGFRTVRDAAANASDAEIAVRDGGPVLLGAGTYLRAMIDAADGRIPRVGTDPLHAQLSREIGPGALRITVVLTTEQRRTLSEELARGGAQGSPAASMIGMGLAVSFDTRVGLSAVVACDDPIACERLGKTFDARRASTSEDMLFRVIGATPIIERLKIGTQGSRIRANVDMSVDEASGLVERSLVLRQALQKQEALDSLEQKRPELVPQSPPQVPASALVPAPSTLPPVKDAGP